VIPDVARASGVSFSSPRADFVHGRFCVLTERPRDLSWHV
jgi:hypothetical protein